MGIEKEEQHASISAYLELEAKSEIKHEYEDGLILAMSGGTIIHGVLCGNIYAEIRRKLKNNRSDCKVLGSEVRIRIKEKASFVYPDAMVICDKIEVSETDKNAIVNPVLVVEVLSESTESYDRGDKFFKYRQLKSLKEYVLINQYKPMVEIFYKKDDNVWEILRTVSLEKSFTLKSINATIKMDELYQDTEVV